MLVHDENYIFIWKSQLTVHPPTVEGRGMVLVLVDDGFENMFIALGT